MTPKRFAKVPFIHRLEIFDISKVLPFEDNIGLFKVHSM